MKDVVIIGASGHGEVVADIVKLNGDHFIGFLDDDPAKNNVIGSVSDWEKYSDCYFVVAIGNSNIRKQIVNRVSSARWYTAIHPSAVIADNAIIGEGTVIAANAVVNPSSSIGKHCIVNTAAVVEHDNVIQDFVHISVGVRIGGTVEIGESSWIGIGACIVNNHKICHDCTIGAGAVVIQDIVESGTYVGIPARRLVND